MKEVIRIYSKRRSDEIEQITGIRVVANVFVKRGQDKPLFVRSIVAQQNR